MNKPLDSREVERPPTDWTSVAMTRRVRRRYAAERRFRLFGLAAIVLAVGFLLFLLGTMVVNGARGFLSTEVALTIDFPAAGLGLTPPRLQGPGADLALAGAQLERHPVQGQPAVGVAVGQLSRTHPRRGGARY